MTPQRLRQRQDFARLKAEGRSLSHRLCVLSYLPNQRDYNRYGMIVGRSIGKAVQRNRVRRRLREALYRRAAYISYSGDPSGCDIVIIARPPIVEATFQSVVEALDNLLRRAGLLHSDS